MKYFTAICCLFLIACQIVTSDQQSVAVDANDSSNHLVNVSDNQPTPKSVFPITKESENILHQWQQGKIVFNSFEGGFYGIVLASGERLLPINLDKTYQKAEMSIRIKGVYLEIMSTKQWGKPFEVHQIEIISSDGAEQIESNY